MAMTNISGSCLCGSLKYESSAKPLMTAACHCTNCRKQSGSAFSMNIGVPTESITISGDTLKTFTDTGDSGSPVLRKFCSNCGSPILSQLMSNEGLSFLKSGTLHDSSWVSPDVQIWCDEKISWSSLPDDIPQIPKNPPAG